MDESIQDIKINFGHRDANIEKLDKLCQHLIAKKDFSILTYEESGVLIAHGSGFDPEFEYSFQKIQELAPLAKDFDRILICTDGYSFVIYCIKNAIGGGHKVSTGLERLRDVGKECLPYTGTVQGNKLPVSLFVIEVTDSSIDDFLHLKPLKCMPGKQKVAVRAFGLNFKTGKVWTNIFFNGIFAGGKFLQKTLLSISKNEKVDVQRVSAINSQVSSPLLTYGFIAVFVVLFLLELVASHSWLAPSGVVLIALGALNSAMVIQGGEWYRMISAAFLHGGYAHLIVNCIAFFFGGLVLEIILGRAWLFTIFILSAIGGSFASLAINSPETISVGASGGIMGLVAASFMIAFRLPHGHEKTQIQMRTLYMFIPAIIPIYANRGGANIDYAGHIGGAVAGLAIAFFIYKSWAKDAPEPSSMGLAKGLATLCGVITLIVSAQVLRKQGDYRKNLGLVVQLMPEEEVDRITKSGNKLSEQEKYIDELAEKYPNDPRSYYFQALVKNESGDFAPASGLLGKALSKIDILREAFPDGELEKELRLFLAKTLMDQSKTAEARSAILPVCAGLERVDNHWLTAEWINVACGK